MKNKRILLILPFLIFISSCRDIFEEDISNSTVQLIAPFNADITVSNNLTFQWTNVEGALNYEIKIVSPTFDSIQQIVIDSTTTVKDLLLTLSPGNYEWKVRARNNAYQTAFSSVFSFTIDSSYDLSAQTILLSNPLNNFYTNTSNIDFGWQELYAAESYDFIVKSGADWATGTEVVNEAASANSFTNTTTLNEGQYLWTVLANNSLPSATSYTQSHTLYIDQTIPNVSVLISPDEFTPNLLADSLALFNWTKPLDVGIVQSPVVDSVFWYSDTLLAPVNGFYIMNEDSLLQLPTVGTYFWRVKTFDQAGNVATLSYAKKFIVQ